MIKDGDIALNVGKGGNKNKPGKHSGIVKRGELRVQLCPVASVVQNRYILL
jgi:hypothetical protein